MPYMSVSGLNAFYREEGAGPTVILGHSSSASSGQWRALMASLRHRYRLIAPDHVGYGRTSAPAGGTPLLEQELALIGALLDAAHEPAHLVGHSYGGALMARAAMRAPQRVRSLTLIEPTLFHVLAATQRTEAYREIREVADRVIRHVGAGEPEEAARGFIDYWMARGAYDAMDERVRASVAAGMAKVRDEWPFALDAQGATLEALAALRMPIQLVAGSATTAAARGVIEALRGLWPSASYAEIAGAGHMCPLTHPEAVNAVLARFLDGCVQA